MTRRPRFIGEPPGLQLHDRPAALRAIAARSAPGGPRRVSSCSADSAAAASVIFEETPLAIDAASGRFEFVVELAVSPEQRGQGLMFREELAEDRGMLFDFGRPQRASMWMRNTYVPLDMLFIAADGRITQIAIDTQPLSDAVIASREPVRAVLELRAGVTAKLGIRPGDRIVHPCSRSPSADLPRLSAALRTPG